MLLYAKTGERITPNLEFSLSGNKVMVKTLDLGVSFKFIAKQLDDIVTTYFDPEGIATGLA